MAIALRNRWRRQQLPREVADEIVPKNILMIGPTGVGKTEIARRLAKLAARAIPQGRGLEVHRGGLCRPRLRVDVRDLTEIGVAMVREERRDAVAATAAERAEERLLDLLLPPGPPSGAVTLGAMGTMGNASPTSAASTDRRALQPVAPIRVALRLRKTPTRRARSCARSCARAASRSAIVEIEVEDGAAPSLEMFTPQGVEEVGINLKEMMPGLFARRRRQKVTVAEAREACSRPRRPRS